MNYEAVAHFQSSDQVEFRKTGLMKRRIDMNASDSSRDFPLVSVVNCSRVDLRNSTNYWHVAIKKRTIG
jgi:hypothetical protein